MAKYKKPEGTEYETGYGFTFNPEARPDAYLRWAQVYAQMIVHTQGHNPGKLLASMRPNEMQEVFNYRMNNFEAITMGAISRAKNEIVAPISTGRFDAYLDESIEEYVEMPVFGMTKAYGTGFNYWNYIYKVALDRMFDDPNGYLTWLPFGEGLSDKSKKVECKAYQIYSVCIVRFTDDYITFFCPEERFNLASGRLGRIFYTITREAYYRHTEIEIQKENTFGTEEIYKHGLNRIPITLNGGIRKSAIGTWDYKTQNALFGETAFSGWSPFIQSGGANASFVLQDMTMPLFIDYFESFLMGFVPYANEALKCFDDWKGSRVMTSNPIRVEKQMPCTAEGCNNGRVWGRDDSGSETSHNCGACNGTGVNVRSPFGTYIVKVPDTTANENQTLVDDPVSYVSPPVDGLTYMQTAWEGLIKKAEQELYQLFTETVQSGEAKKVDREGKYALISRMTDHIFDHVMFNHLWDLTCLRNLINPEVPKLVKPTSFTIRDEADIIEELKQLDEANAPIPVKVKAQKDLMKKRFSGKEDASEVIEVMALFDPLYGQSMADIESMQRMGAIDTRSVQKHAYCFNILERVMEKNGEEWFRDNPEDVIIQAMQADFDLVVPPPADKIIIPLNEG